MPRAIRANRRVEVPQYPWDRQAGESEPAHAAFLAYRDLVDERNQPKRSYVAVEQARGLADSLVRRWAERWEWPARALAWDNWNRQRRDAERRKQQDDLNDRHTQQAGALLAVAIRLLQPPPRWPEERRREYVPKPGAVQAATQAMKEAQRMQRLTAGMPTEHTRQDVTMKQAVTEALEGQKLLFAVVQEHLCDECRERIRDEWERIKRHHRDLEGQLA